MDKQKERLAGNDPLEAAKIKTANGAAPTPSPAKVEAKAEAKPVVKPADPVVAPVVPVKKVPQYEVLNDITLSWGRGMIRLKKGGRVSEQSHGQGAVDKMIAAGAALKRVEG